MEKFRQVLEDEYLHRKLLDGPSPDRATVNGDHIGVHEQKDGRFYIGAAPTVGRISGTLLTALGDVVEQYGAAGVRLTSYQKLVVLGVDAEDVEDVVAALDRIGLSARPSTWRRSTMACTGIEFCKLAIVDTKARAAALVQELERRFPGMDTPITINVNGCPNACARTQVADIGLKGQLVLDDDGNQVEGFQVHLGGGIGLTEPIETAFGRKLRAHKVTSADLDDYVASLVSNYLAERADGESFASWVARADEDALRGERALAEVGGMTAATTTRAARARGAHTDGRSEQELRDLVKHAGAELELAPAEVIIEWAVATFGKRFCVTSSMADAVLSHLASTVAPGIDVVFLDTGYHFAETIGTRDAVEATLPVRMLNVRPELTVEQQDAVYGKDLFLRDPDLCCAHAQGPPAGAGARRVRRVGHRSAPRGDPQPGHRAGHRLGRREGQGEGLPAGPLERRAGPALRRREPGADEPAPRGRLPLDRLLPLHPPGGTRRGPTQRPVGRHRQDRVRHPLIRRPTADELSRTQLNTYRP